MVSEWSDIFSAPSSALIAAGVTRAASSPAALARRILALDAARADAEARAAAARAAADREIADLRAALRDAGRVTREQSSHEIATLKGAADTAVARERAACAIADKALAATRATMASDVACEVRQAVAVATVELRGAVTTAHLEAVAAIVAAHAERDAALQGARASEAMRVEVRACAALAAENSNKAVAAASAHAIETLQAAQYEAASALQVRDELDATWRERWTRTNALWENSTSALRVSTLENQCAFLTARVRELQTLLDAMQAALAGSHGATSVGTPPGAEPVGPVVTSRRGSGQGRSSARPWSGRGFGAFSGLVHHAGAAGDGLSFAAGPSPVATAYAWVR